ncbi:Spliceosome-associated protein 49 [Coemansia sp. RSA 1200]|nr:Spliceosome-associated protein 49 [Coemansia sp. RSA 1200]
MAQKFERNQEATVYIGNLDDRVTDELIWELMVQAGPVANVHLPKDRVTQSTQGYGFCEFQSAEDADYAVKIMNMVKLFGKPMRINKSSTDKRMQDVGAKLFIGNLDPQVDDEKLLHDTFGVFGQMAQPPKIARDSVSGNSKGFAFVSYATFEAADAAIEAMNGQYLANKPVAVNYAFKKDARGERHGSAAERLLAAQAQKNMPGEQQQQQQYQQYQQQQYQQYQPPPPPQQW